MEHTLIQALTRGRGRERPFRCPVHDDRHASASVNVIKGLWVCYSCGAKGTIDSVTADADVSFGADIEELLGYEQRVYTESWLDQYENRHRPVHPYWLSRFTEAAARRFRLGYDHDRASPCYPIRSPGGDVLGVVRRQLDQMPKYLYPRGVTKSELLFNYNPERLNYVVLVEGAMDVVACWEAGHVAFGMYGSMLHANQLALLQRTGVSRVVDALDNDSAGRNAVNGWTTSSGNEVPGLDARLSAAGFEVLSVDWSNVDAKDIADCDISTRKKLLDPLAL